MAVLCLGIGVSGECAVFSVISGTRVARGFRVFGRPALNRFCDKVGRVLLFAFASCTLVVQPQAERSVRTKYGLGEQTMADVRMVTPNAFEGSDVQRINKAIQAVAEAGAQVLIPRLNHSADDLRDIWLLD